MTTLSAVHRRMSAALRALYRGVVGALVALDRRVVGRLLRLYRRVARALGAVQFRLAGTLLTLYRGVVGTLLALCCGSLVALYRGMAGVVLALHRRAAETLPARRHHAGTTLLVLRRRMEGTLLAAYRGVAGLLLVLSLCVAGALLALSRGAAGALRALNRRVVETRPALRRRAVRTYVVARRPWSTFAGLFEGTAPVGSRIRQFGDDAGIRGRTIWRYCGVAATRVRARLAKDIGTIGLLLSMVGRQASVAARTVHERCRASLLMLIRNAQRLAMAHQRLRMRMPSRSHLLEMYGPLWRTKIHHVRVPVMNVTLAAFTGGTAVGALVMWLLGVQPGQPRPTDSRLRFADGAVTLAPAVAPQPVAGDRIPAVTVYAASSATMPTGRRQSPVAQRATASSSASAQVAAMPAAMTVVSTPVGARVTVDGIGWGETPVTIRHLPPGQKVVRVTKDGYVSQQRIVSLADDRRSASVRVVLRVLN